MDALTASGCRFILNEVFECENLDDLLRRGDLVHSLLPEPKSNLPVSQKRRPITRPGPNRALQRTRLRSPSSFFR